MKTLNIMMHIPLTHILFFPLIIRASCHQNLSYQTHFYNNSIDHSAPSPRLTFRHRYLLNDDFFGSKPIHSIGCPGPILLYAGNEGPITTFWEANGFMKYLAEKHGGLLLFAEERYYGESVVDHHHDRQHLSFTNKYEYLTTAQVLQDYVELLNHVKKKRKATFCPTVVFGGSYGGTLAAYLRSEYPDDVQGALSSSSEMGYYDIRGWAERGVSQFTFSEIVARQYDEIPGCLEAIWDATDAILAASADVITKTFNYCSNTALLPDNASTFLYGLEGLPQMNYPYAIGNMPAWPVAEVCAILTSEDDPILQRAAESASLSLGYSLQGDCLPTFEEGPGNVPGDGPGRGSWGYQSCTETLHTFSSVGRGGMGIRDFNYTRAVQPLVDDVCMDLYGTAPDVDFLVGRFGGYDIARTTSNTIFSVGALDPWGGGGVTAGDGGPDAENRRVYFFTMQNGAHHLDLRGWNDADPLDVIDTRKKEEEIIIGWISDWVDKGSYALTKPEHVSW